MCGRLCCTLSAHDVIENCQPNGVNVIKRFSDDYKPIYNGPPTSRVPVLAWKSNFRNDDICDANSETDICLAAMRWGLMPSFVNSSYCIMMSVMILRSVIGRRT